MFLFLWFAQTTKIFLQQKQIYGMLKNVLNCTYMTMHISKNFCCWKQYCTSLHWTRELLSFIVLKHERNLNIISKRSTLKINQKKLLLQLQKMATHVGNIFSAAADQHGKSFCPQIQSGFHLETHKLCLLVQQIWFPMSRKVDSSWLLVWIFAVHANGRSVTRCSWLFTVTVTRWLKHELRVHD